MGPSPLHRGREARASPQSPEAQGLWKVLPWDLGRDSGRMVFTGRAAGLGGAAAPTSCQNKDQDSECWVCPLWAAWYTPPSPNQGKATMRVRCAQAMVLQQPSWMCLPSRRPHLPPSLHAECPAWTLGLESQDRLHSWAAFGFRSWVGWLQADPDPSSSSGSGDTSFLQVEEGDPREPVDKTLDGPVGSLSERQSSLPHLQPPAGFL